LSEAHRPYEPPRSKTSAAIRYVLNNKEVLQRFLQDGRIPVDNGAIERLHIQVALTRKNSLFAGSDASAERAAVAYTILASCELADVDLVAYLTNVLPRQRLASPTSCLASLEAFAYAMHPTFCPSRERPPTPEIPPSSVTIAV